MLQRSLQHLLIALLLLTTTAAISFAQTSVTPPVAYVPPQTGQGTQQPPPTPALVPNTWQVYQVYCDRAGNLHVEYRGPGGVIHAQTYAGGCRADATTGTSVGEVVNQAHASCDINRGSITITGDLVQRALTAGGVMVNGYHIKCSLAPSGQYQCTIATSLNGEVVDSFTWGGNAFTWAYACRSAIDDIIDDARNAAREFCDRHDPQIKVGPDGKGGLSFCVELKF